jgi:hypothetical protein
MKYHSLGMTFPSIPSHFFSTLMEVFTINIPPPTLLGLWEGDILLDGEILDDWEHIPLEIDTNWLQARILSSTKLKMFHFLR